MIEYLQAQQKLMSTLRNVSRIVGIIAGVLAIVTPFVSLGSSIGFIVVGVPSGIILMFLAIGLRGRAEDLRKLSVSTKSPETFNPLLNAYVKKISIHRVILWVFGGIIILENLSIFNLGTGVTSDIMYNLLSSSWLFLLLGGYIIYLGFVLSKQVKDLTPALVQ